MIPKPSPHPHTGPWKNCLLQKLPETLETTVIDCTWWSHRPSFFHSVWMRQTQLPTTLQHFFSIFFPVAIFRISYAVILGHQDQPTPFFELNSLLPIDHGLPDSSESFHQGRGRCPPPGQQVSAGLLHLPASGLLFPLPQCDSRVWAPFSLNCSRRSTRAPTISWNCKTSMAAMPSS